eukprot:1083270-Alexandrium_andersonii.AAC.1
MSASLVGSEMCIRDRAEAELLLLILHASTQHGHGEHTIACAHPPHAVSYTHLTLPTICSV